MREIERIRRGNEIEKGGARAARAGTGGGILGLAGRGKGPPHPFALRRLELARLWDVDQTSENVDED